MLWANAIQLHHLLVSCVFRLVHLFLVVKQFVVCFSGLWTCPPSSCSRPVMLFYYHWKFLSGDDQLNDNILQSCLAVSTVLSATAPLLAGVAFSNIVIRCKFFLILTPHGSPHEMSCVIHKINLACNSYYIGITILGRDLNKWRRKNNDLIGWMRKNSTL